LRAWRASVTSVGSVVKKWAFEVYVFFFESAHMGGAQKNFYHRAHRDRRGAPRAQEGVLRVKLSGTEASFNLLDLFQN